MNTTEWRVYVGRQVQSGPNPHQESKSVSRIIIHADYVRETYENNIALLELSSEVSFSDYIQPVCLAAASSTISAGAVNLVTGFGTLAENGKHIY